MAAAIPAREVVYRALLTFYLRVDSRYRCVASAIPIYEKFMENSEGSIEIQNRTLIMTVTARKAVLVKVVVLQPGQGDVTCRTTIPAGV